MSNPTGDALAQLERSEMDMIMLAMSKLAVRRPRFVHAITAIVDKIGERDTFDGFYAIHIQEPNAP